MKKKIGVICMGESADKKNHRDLEARFAPELDMELVGLLDGLDAAQQRQLAPQGDESFIVTSNAHGENLQIAEHHAKRLVNERIAQLRSQHIERVLILCTGAFDRPAEDSGLLYIPEDLLYGILRGLGQKSLGFIVPEPEQVADSQKQYADLNPIIKSASPYKSMELLRETARAFREEPVQVIVTDCMGFTAEMGQLVAEESGKQVFVPRVVLPNLIKSIF